ncbi:MAG: RidA family protein [Bacteroidota bacterium]|nr:RidA family protein [Bacteroidota bacterium]
MKKQVIFTPNAPEAIGPYSQAIFIGDTLYLSGQIPMDAVSGEIVGDNIKEQTDKVLQNIGAVLKEAGLNFNHVVKATCLLSDMNNFSEMNEMYARYFQINPPARAAFAVKELPKSVLIEIEVIAVR